MPNILKAKPFTVEKDANIFSFAKGLSKSKSKSKSKRKCKRKKRK